MSYEPSSFLTGEVRKYAGSTAPSGWLLCYGQAISRTTYAQLFAVLGTTYGSGDGVNTFNVPDLRGRSVAGKDDMGGSAANRITSGGSGITGTTLGATGGTETHTLTTAQLATHTHTVTDAGHTHGVTDAGHTHGSGSGGFLTKGTTLNSNGAFPNAGTSHQTPPPVITNTVSSTTGISVNSGTTGITVANNGSGTAHQNTQPTIILNFLIKY